MDVRTSQLDNAATRAARLPRLIVGTLVALVIVLAALLAIAPPGLEFGVAVSLAIWWCLWLDRLSDPTDAWPAPTPDGGNQLPVDADVPAADPVKSEPVARDRAA
jgi:hypothetical protein